MESKKNFKKNFEKSLTRQKESVKLSAERNKGSKFSFKAKIYVRLITLTQFIIRAPFKLENKFSFAVSFFVSP